MNKKIKGIMVSILALTTLFTLAGCNVDDGKSIKESKELDSFDKIDLDLDVIEIHLEQGDNFSIKYEGSEKLEPKYSVDGGVLKVRCKKRVTLGFSMVTSESGITITVPKDTKLSDVDLSVDTGEIEVNDCNIDKMEVDTDTGSVDIKNTSVNNLNGNVDTGDITVSILGNADSYNYDLKTDTGDVVLNDIESDDGISKDNGSDKNIKLSSDTGDVKLSFTK